MAGADPFWVAHGSMRCELVIPTAGERTGIRVRRLIDVRYFREVIWRDEP